MIGPLVVIGFVVAVAMIIIVFGGPAVLAILPIVIGGAVLAFLEIYRRREAAQGMSKFRREADSDTTDFTGRDRETQA